MSAAAKTIGRNSGDRLIPKSNSQSNQAYERTDRDLDPEIDCGCTADCHTVPIHIDLHHHGALCLSYREALQEKGENSERTLMAPHLPSHTLLSPHH